MPADVSWEEEHHMEEVEPTDLVGVCRIDGQGDHEMAALHMGERV